MKIRYYILGLSFWLGLCGGCQQEELIRPYGEGDLAEGLRVVDFTTDEGLDTRSIHQDVPKNERISSLLYLLYNNDGELIRYREIPDIGKETEWPLRRATMTWAQREALKDTLETGSSYTIVFAANVDPKLWSDQPVTPPTPPEEGTGGGTTDPVNPGGGEDGGEPGGDAGGEAGSDAGGGMPEPGGSEPGTLTRANGDFSGSGKSPLKNSGITDNTAYENPGTAGFDYAYLQLPERPFTDGTMFYLYTRTISSDELSAADRDTPFNCRILLRRVVTRTDFFGERLPALEADGSTETNRVFTPEAKAYVSPFLSDLYFEFCGAFEAGATDPKNVIAKNLNTELAKFPDALSAYFESKKVTAAEGSDLTDEQKANNATMDSYKALCAQLKTEINAGMYQDSILYDKPAEGVEPDPGLYERLRIDLLGNAALRAQWDLGDWREKEVEISYHDATSSGGAKPAHNQLFLKAWNAGGTGVTKSVRMRVDTAGVLAPDRNAWYDGFTWIGFGLNAPKWNDDGTQSSEAGTKSQVKELTFYDSSDATTAAFTISAAEAVSTNQTVNQWYQAAYQPVAEVTWSGSMTTDTQKKSFEIKGCDLLMYFFKAAKEEAVTPPVVDNPTDTPDTPTEPDDPTDPDTPTTPDDPTTGDGSGEGSDGGSGEGGENNPPEVPKALTRAGEGDGTTTTQSYTPEFIQAVKNALADESYTPTGGGSSLHTTYGDGHAVTLTLDIPDLSAEGALTVEPRWRVEAKNE